MRRWGAEMPRAMFKGASGPFEGGGQRPGPRCCRPFVYRTRLFVDCRGPLVGAWQWRLCAIAIATDRMLVLDRSARRVSHVREKEIQAPWGAWISHHRALGTKCV